MHIKRLTALRSVLAAFLAGCVLFGISASAYAGEQNPTFYYRFRSYDYNSVTGEIKEIWNRNVYAPVDKDMNYGAARAVSEPNYKALMLNGTFVLEAVVVTENGRTLVPLRIVAEGLNAGVSWDAAAKSVIITRGETRVTLAVNDKTAYLNGSPVALDAPVRLCGGVTYVPLRFIGEALGAKVGSITMGTPTEVMDTIPLTVVWADSAEFLAESRVSKAEAIAGAKRSILSDIKEGYDALVGRITASGEVPRHFDSGHVLRLLNERTANAGEFGEFSCYVAIGEPNIIVNRITQKPYVFWANDIGGGIIDYDLRGYLFSFNLE